MDPKIYTRNMSVLRLAIIDTVESSNVARNEDIIVVLSDLAKEWNDVSSIKIPEPVVSERFGIASEGKPMRRAHLDVCREFMDACHAAGWQCTYQASGAPPRVGGNWTFDKALIEARTWAAQNQPKLYEAFDAEVNR